MGSLAKRGNGGTGAGTTGMVAVAVVAGLVAVGPTSQAVGSPPIDTDSIDVGGPVDDVVVIIGGILDGLGSSDLTICQGTVFTDDWVHDITIQGERVHLTHEEATGHMSVEYHSDGTIHDLRWTMDSTQDEWMVTGSDHHGGFETAWTWNGLAMSHEASLSWRITTGDVCDIVDVDGRLEGEPLFTTGAASVIAEGSLCNVAYQPQLCTV